MRGWVWLENSNRKMKFMSIQVNCEKNEKVFQCDGYLNFHHFLQDTIFSSTCIRCCRFISCTCPSFRYMLNFRWQFIALDNDIGCWTNSFKIMQRLVKIEFKCLHRLHYHRFINSISILFHSQTARLFLIGIFRTCWGCYLSFHGHLWFTWNHFKMRIKVHNVVVFGDFLGPRPLKSLKNCDTLRILEKFFEFLNYFKFAAVKSIDYFHLFFIYFQWIRHYDHHFNCFMSVSFDPIVLLYFHGDSGNRCNSLRWQWIQYTILVFNGTYERFQINFLLFFFYIGSLFCDPTLALVNFPFDSNNLHYWTMSHGVCWGKCSFYVDLFSFFTLYTNESWIGFVTNM